MHLLSWFWLSSMWFGCPKSDPDQLVEQLDREVLALQEHLRQCEQKLQECGSGGVVDNPLYIELKKVLPGDNVDVQREGTATRLVISASHIFADPLRLAWRDEGQPTVSLIGTALQINATTQVLIVGHTSDREIPKAFAKSYSSNADFSANMAMALADRFAADFDLKPSRFTIAGRGPHSPRDSNDLDSGRDRNQRVEIWIFPAEAPLPNPG